MVNRKHFQGRKLSFQQLENRCLMAGNVTAAVVNHGLTLTGDNGSNQIDIAQVATNQFSVTGRNGTTVNGKASQTFSITGNISANFKAGDDVLAFDGSLSGFMTLPGSVNVVLGDGKNGLSMDHTYMNGNLSVSGGSGNDIVSINNSAVGMGTYNGGSNDCSIALGGGENQIQLNYLQVERDLLINDGNSSGEEIFSMGSHVGRDTTINTGAGADLVQLNEFYGKGSLNINTGAGRDAIVLGESVSIVRGTVPDPGSQKSLNVAKLAIDMGAGDDQISLGNVNATTSVMDGGAGNDSIYLDLQPNFTFPKKYNWEHEYVNGRGVIFSNDPTGTGHH